MAASEGLTLRVRHLGVKLTTTPLREVPRRVTRVTLVGLVCSTALATAAALEGGPHPPSTTGVPKAQSRTSPANQNADAELFMILVSVELLSKPLR